MEAISPCTPVVPHAIAGHPAILLDVDLGVRRVRLHAVRDLEALVDRGALLRGEIEPPYWAHLWSGASVLAAYLARCVPLAGRRVLEIGCGLALPGVTAATLGADVTLVDAAPDALAFAAASAAANGVRCVVAAADFTRLDPGWRFDVVLAAEIAYDRERWGELAAVCERHLAPGGATYLADGYRTDTRGFWAALGARGLAVHAMDLRPAEEGRRVSVRIAEIRRPIVRPRGTPRPAP
ncbi:MAG: methyltransferase domain-containing protein [Deltaproteobacteria bacterium]|nr:methyltransferase domain-containing protein [Deltaproteobacteria bacterium]